MSPQVKRWLDLVDSRRMLLDSQATIARRIAALEEQMSALCEAMTAEEADEAMRLCYRADAHEDPTQPAGKAP